MGYRELVRLVWSLFVCSSLLLLGSCAPEIVVPSDETTGETGDGDGDGDGCEFGSEGCLCDIGAVCDAGLVCVNGICGVSECGNGVLGPGEECDDGNTSNTDTCVEGCKLAACGDGYVGPGEGCDDGNAIEDDACDNACKLASCGDGEVQQGEACDDGDANNEDECLDTCALASCGDGHVHEGFEACDDANPNDGDACVSCEVAVCGDGHVQADVEACDDGNMDETDACLSSCESASCGDGHVHAGSEDCDDANADDTDACLDSCEAASCGDGHLQVGVEMCDDGNFVDDDECDNDCELTSCGDGLVQMGEECDDGDDLNSNACVQGCRIASCGDGFVFFGEEQCDDGNLDNTDDCPQTCSDHVCGDGFVHAETEACDDANGIDTDACLQSCVAASCGDGIIHAGVEECEDGNLDETDGCAACQLAVCGDGFLHAGFEVCDDGNDVESDGCKTDCEGTPIHTVALGWGNTCVLFEGETTVRCWGRGDKGANGVNNEINYGVHPGSMPSPNVLFDLLEGSPTQLEGGEFHFCARLSSGQVVCWGGNEHGELGQGSIADLGDDPWELPAQPIEGLEDITQVAVGRYHSCARKADGGVRCWGYNMGGWLGYGHKLNIGDQPGEMPPPFVNVGDPVAALTAGNQHTCALMESGRVRCWGQNFVGQLGIGSVNTYGDDPGEMPPADIDLGPGLAIQIDAGDNHTCALMNTGAVRCWGTGGGGALGYGNTQALGDQPGEMPPPDVDVGGDVVQIAVGAYYTCALLVGGNVRCWGENNVGQLGYGNSPAWVGDNPGEMPPPNVDIGGAAVGLFSEWRHACALLTDGSLRCWGGGANGNLGYENAGQDIGNSPGEMPPPPVPVW
jgi:cysteine-rich repeat protein